MYKQRNCHCDKRIRMGMPYEYKWSEHHCVIPVVNAAASAAFVLHKPCLERAEKQNTYHITYGESEAYEQHYACIEYTCKIEYAEDRVKRQPTECNEYSRTILLQNDFFSSCWFEVTLKLLLTSHAFKR